MLKLELKSVVTFYTSNEAMALDKACKEERIEGCLISAPRSITSDCGISYATKIENKELIKNILKKKNIEYDNIVDIEI